MDCAGRAAAGVDVIFALSFARTFFPLFSFGVLIPAASRSSVKLDFRNVSKRRISGTACEHPLNPKYAVPL